jgi:hypothetical protein|nr:hypothetical protein [uncultured Acetatifactor sp.]
MKIRNGFRLKVHKRANITEILTSLTSLSLILNCQSIWQNVTDTDYHIYEICAVLVLTCSLHMAIKYGISKAARRYVLFSAVWYYCIIFVAVLFSVSTDNLFRFLSRFIMFPFCVLYFASAASVEQKMCLFKSFANWTGLIAWISILFFGGSTIGMIGESGLIKADWFGTYGNYYNLYFSSPYQIIDWFGTGIRRNLGIFVEGPMYMIVLILALMFSLVIKDYYPIAKWKVSGIVLAILTTASVTGYIFLMLIGFICTINKYRNKQNQIIIGITGFVLAAVAVCVLFIAKSGTASYIARSDDYIAGIRCWLQSPIIGNGYENIELLRRYMSTNREWNQGFSNTIFSVLAYGGLVFAVPFVMPVVHGILYASSKHDYKNIVFCVIYIGLYFTVIEYTFFINFFIWAYLFCLGKGFFRMPEPRWEINLNGSAP